MQIRRVLNYLISHLDYKAGNIYNRISILDYFPSNSFFMFFTLLSLQTDVKMVVESKPKDKYFSNQNYILHLNLLLYNILWNVKDIALELLYLSV